VDGIMSVSEGEDELAKKFRKRRAVAEEILATEKDYIYKLKIAIEVSF
jgi:hypothetical protein